MKTAIVCEGGGMRGVFTAGVLQAFMEAGFLADELVGVSAGASNGCSYVSHQMGRGLRTNVDYAGDKRYMGLGNFIRTGSLFGMEYVFNELPNKLDPFDYEAFHASPCNFFAGATDVATGQIHFFGKQDIDTEWHAIRASCALPMLANMETIAGRQYLDGGIADPIPMDKAIADGCERLVVVLTRERGYKKEPMGARAYYKRLYRHHPALVRALDMRHDVYNQSLQRVETLEAEGRAIVVAPPQPLAVGRFGSDAAKMATAYEVGRTAGTAAVAKL